MLVWNALSGFGFLPVFVGFVFPLAWSSRFGLRPAGCLVVDIGGVLIWFGCVCGFLCCV